MIISAKNDHLSQFKSDVTPSIKADIPGMGAAIGKTEKKIKIRLRIE
jgi:hypothetical protein